MVAPSDTKAETRCIASRSPSFPPLDQVTKPVLSTAETAYYLNRAKQTLWEWHHLGIGLVSARRVGARLAWPTAEVKRVLGVAG